MKYGDTPQCFKSVTTAFMNGCGPQMKKCVSADGVGGRRCIIVHRRFRKDDRAWRNNEDRAQYDEGGE